MSTPKSPTIETLAIGDELLTGRTLDSNSHFVGGRLFREGLRLLRTSVVLDDRETIQSQLRQTAERSDFLVVFGGLGPTSDDLTVDTICDLMGTAPETHPPAEKRMREVYARRNRPVTPEALRQVRYPKGAEVFGNDEGLAPGFAVELTGCKMFFLPGVPQEMRVIFDRWVLPQLVQARGEGRFHWRTWRCIGIPESELQGALNEVEAGLGEGMWLGYRTYFPENHVTLYSHVSGEAFGKAAETVSRAVSSWAYAEGEVRLEEHLVARLRERGETLALAESCTGGEVAHRLTSVPHASTCLWGCAVVYQPEAKKELAGVHLENAEAAVSEACTKELARNMLVRSGANWAAAVTGYMGPTGGTPADPVGTVYVSVCGRNGQEKTLKRQLPPRSREDSQWGAASLVLNAVRECLAEG